VGEGEEEEVTMQDATNDPTGIWWLDRMSGDDWSFGLLLCVDHVEGWHRDEAGNLWVTVEMTLEANVLKAASPWGIVIGAPTSRSTASINAAHVVAAIELADT
jgi:hypothetical protein